jgi:hypothetical protein
MAEENFPGTKLIIKAKGKSKKAKLKKSGVAIKTRGEGAESVRNWQWPEIVLVLDSERKSPRRECIIRRYLRHMS